MLTALITKAEEGQWFRLFDKEFANRNLLASFQEVLLNDGAPGVDHVTCREFEWQLPDSIWDLSDRLNSGTFTPQAIRRVQIPKPGTAETRPLGIPTVRDRVVQAEVEGFDFLGYHFRGRKHCVRKKSVQKLRATLGPLTRRNNGQSLQCVIARINPTLRGWFAYFQHSRRTLLQQVDRWVRQRLRGILRKLRKGRGRTRGDDLKLWGLAFFWQTRAV